MCIHTTVRIVTWPSITISLPINGSQLWEKTNQTAIKPAAYTRQPGRPRKDEVKAVARVRRKLSYARTKAAAAKKAAAAAKKAADAAKKAALNASQPNAAETARIGLRASKRQRT
ncbi:hypothetical protein L3X38_002507 [Prunus dulcis]|uniref:Uncharacterized protein n=1 Tax=Prunus dulcis TaxID=3755 RepID=A0AAD4WUL1_PRUDU|nr:hypothetical protein L3X38_002507 [Prunus dulcis]